MTDRLLRYATYDRDYTPEPRSMVGRRCDRLTFADAIAALHGDEPAR